MRGSPGRDAEKARIRSWFKLPEEARVFVAGSTNPGEDEPVMDAFMSARRSHPELRLVIAPRQIERREEIAGLARNRGLPAAGGASRRASHGRRGRIHTRHFRGACAGLCNRGCDFRGRQPDSEGLSQHSPADRAGQAGVLWAVYVQGEGSGRRRQRRRESGSRSRMARTSAGKSTACSGTARRWRMSECAASK